MSNYEHYDRTKVKEGASLRYMRSIGYNAADIIIDIYYLIKCAILLLAIGCLWIVWKLKNLVKTKKKFKVPEIKKPVFDESESYK